METTEYVIWGINPHGTGEETILVSRMPECFGRGDGPVTCPCLAADIAEACARRGALSVRVQRVNIDDPFAGWGPPR